MKKIIPVVILSLLFAVPVSAQQPPLEVNGIMNGADPAAIVNGNLVTPGDRVGELRVEKIMQDAVIFVRPDGSRLTAHLKKEDEGASAQETKKGTGVKRVKTKKASEDELKKIFGQAIQYIKEADQTALMKIPSVSDLKTAKHLYDKAERILRRNVEKVPDMKARMYYQNIHHRVMLQSESVSKKRAKLEDDILSGIRKKSLVLGMTKSDVRRSWGKPENVENANFGHGITERWVFQPPKQKKRYVNFADDVLVGIQFQ